MNSGGWQRGRTRRAGGAAALRLTSTKLKEAGREGRDGHRFSVGLQVVQPEFQWSCSRGSQIQDLSGAACRWSNKNFQRTVIAQSLAGMLL